MLISFEGLDGSGKSTQARLLVERLESEGYPVLFVREPGGTELSERVRSLLLDPQLHIVPFAELLLFSAARAQLVAERIKPALANDNVVICDRFYDSTTAYQGSGRKLEDFFWLRAFNERVTGGLVPDRTYLIELNPADALSRRAVRGQHDESVDDRMESAGLDFYGRVAAGYAALASEEPHRIKVIDGTSSIETIHSWIWEDVRTLLGMEGGTRNLGLGSSS